jgi:hypothetical protein
VYTLYVCNIKSKCENQTKIVHRNEGKDEEFKQTATDREITYIEHITKLNNTDFKKQVECTSREKKKPHINSHIPWKYFSLHSFSP